MGASISTHELDILIRFSFFPFSARGSAHGASREPGPFRTEPWFWGFGIGSGDQTAPGGPDPGDWRRAKVPAVGAGRGGGV